ncbi:hypothetical protein J2W70_002876 [Pseudomonas koreensis]|uniref:hypothetical protein n=1 Tax=Pseudomonas koreensis TaxID=198620 RepID=UPI002859BFC4|nr:hypothetical protein [Pseudomonas koreensis]MDR7055504.1 hypothetical protein [Pseudomonas koreensis]
MKIFVLFIFASLIFVQMALGQAVENSNQRSTSPDNIKTLSEQEFDYREDDALPVEEEPQLTAEIVGRQVVGRKKILMVVGHWTNGFNFDKEKLWQYTFSDDPLSFRNYIQEASGGKLQVEGEMISAEFGPRNCGTGPVLTLADAAAKAQNKTYDYLIAVAECGGGAVAFLPGNKMDIRGQPGSSHVFNHELGHNLGYGHGGTYTKCPKTDKTVFAPDQCITIGYGDTGDSVSGGGTLYPAHNRWFSGWLNDTQAAVINRTGLYRLTTLGTPGPQVYTIRRPATPSWIALEFRQPTRFDLFPAEDNRVTGVWIRYANMAGTVSNIQLDATPETASTKDPALQPGSSLEDKIAKIKVAVCSADKTGAIVAVAINGQNLPYCTTTVPSPIIVTPIVNEKTGLRPVIEGTAWPGARIVVSTATTPAKTLGETIADAHGKWSFQASDNLALGKHTITSQQFFGPRSSGLAPGRAFEVIDIPIALASILTPLKNIQTGRQPVVTGTGIAGATVMLVEQNQPYKILATTVIDGHGNWAVQIVEPLPTRTFSLTGYQVIDGKRSSWIANHPIQVVDTPAPAEILTPANDMFTGVTPVVTGTGIAGATVTLLEQYQPYKALATAVVDGHGNWSARIANPLPLRKVNLTGYQVIDGKKSGWITNRSIQVVDAPAPALILTPAKNASTGQRPVIMGTGIAGATVTLLEHNQPSKSLATAVVDGNGNWAAQIVDPLPIRTFRLTGYQVIDGKKSGWIADHPIKVVAEP